MVPPSKVKGPRSRILDEATLEIKRTLTKRAVMASRCLKCRMKSSLKCHDLKPPFAIRFLRG